MGVDEIVAGLAQQLAELSEGKLAAGAIDAKGHLFDYGYVDSLSAVSSWRTSRTKYGVQIEDMDLIEKYTTLDAIARQIAESR